MVYDYNIRKAYDLKAMNANNNAFWRDFVIQTVLKRDKHICLNCGSKKNLDVVHKKYGIDITIDDLITLCRSCHKKKDLNVV